MLKIGASVNFYMFRGGMNFGFYSGANYSDKYDSTVKENEPLGKGRF